MCKERSKEKRHIRKPKTETNIMVYVNYTSIKKRKKQGKESQRQGLPIREECSIYLVVKIRAR